MVQKWKQYVLFQGDYNRDFWYVFPTLFYDNCDINKSGIDFQPIKLKDVVYTVSYLVDDK